MLGPLVPGNIAFLARFMAEPLMSDEHIEQAFSPVSQRTTTVASQWYHSGIAVVQYCQHPLVKISLSTEITALSKSKYKKYRVRCGGDAVVIYW